MPIFDKRTVVITGASSGIGRACAAGLAKEGAQVILVGRNPETLAAVVPHGAARLIKCDLTNEAELKALAGELREAGEIHGWVLAAGVHDLRPLMMETTGNLAGIFQTNVHGSLLLLGQALKARLVKPGAAIVMFSSAAAQVGGAGQVSYAASKGAIEAAVRSLAVELSGQKVRVNAIAPGVVQTPMADKYFAKLTEEQKGHLQRRHLLGLGQPDDVANAVCFLLSDAARWITGAVLPVDGGFSIA